MSDLCQHVKILEDGICALCGARAAISLPGLACTASRIDHIRKIASTILFDLGPNDLIHARISAALFHIAEELEDIRKRLRS